MWKTKLLLSEILRGVEQRFWCVKHELEFDRKFCQQLSTNLFKGFVVGQGSAAFVWCVRQKTCLTHTAQKPLWYVKSGLVKKRRSNIAPAPFWLAKSVRAWKAIFAKVVVGRKVCPPYTINCQHIPPMHRLCAMANTFVIVSQAGTARFW